MNKLNALMRLADLLDEPDCGPGHSCGVAKVDPFVGQPVLVRSRNAGVIFGDCTDIDGQVVTLSNARQVWSWTAKEGGTVIDLANNGPSEAKMSFKAGQLVRVVESCAVCLCSTEAAEKFRSIESEGKWK